VSARYTPTAVDPSYLQRPVLRANEMPAPYLSELGAAQDSARRSRGTLRVVCTEVIRVLESTETHHHVPSLRGDELEESDCSLFGMLPVVLWGALAGDESVQSGIGRQRAPLPRRKDPSSGT